jgi:Domain of unknown function (DUF1338)
VIRSCADRGQRTGSGERSRSPTRVRGALGDTAALPDFSTAALFGISKEVTIAELLDVLWRNYVAATPQVEQIRQLLTERGEILCDDHIALRTYAAPGIGIDALARPFEALGWRTADRFHHGDQHLRAGCWQHDDPGLPKVWISELVLDELSPEARGTIDALLGALSGAVSDERAWPWPWPRRPWRVTSAGYRALLAESEVAAWLAVFGPGVHHFAVDLGSLSTFPDLEALGAFLVDHGFRIDDAARRGRRSAPLERLATRSDPAAVELADATLRIPGCPYEFARRPAV